MDFDFCVLKLPASRMRVDKYISDALGICTRNQLQQRLDSLEINGESAKQSRKVMPGDRICFSLEEIPEQTLSAEEIPLEIVYEDDDVLVINKPQGLVVHPGAGNYSGTLVNGLLHHVSDLQPYNNRPGIVHRLDKETSGIIITAKNHKAHEFLSSQFRKRQTEKRYLAVVCGHPHERAGNITTYIRRDRKDRKRMTVSETGGKYAETEYKVLAFYRDYSFVLLRPKTGRTHQLRVHMRHLGCPIAGDPVYGSKKDSTESLMLHAYTLKLSLDKSGHAHLFRAPLPMRFKKMLICLGSKKPTLQSGTG